MRSARLFRALIGATVVAMAGVGVTAAAAPLATEEEGMVCTFEVSSCQSEECPSLCNTYYPGSTPGCIQNCCNCYY